MKVRTVNLLDQEAATTAGQRVIDLDTSDPISQIGIVFRGTNTAVAPTAHPVKAISKIEIVDGSLVLASVSGYEANAAAILDGHQGLYPEITYINDAQAISSVVINFGRKLWDRVLALDPSRYKNLQLKITHNKALGGAAPDAGTLSVFAKCMSEMPTSPIGFLSLKEIKSESLVASAKMTHDLPIDQVIRRIIVQSVAAGKQPHEQYNKLKLSIDQDKVLLLNDARVSDLAKIMEGNPQMFERVYVNVQNNTVTCYITPGYANNISLLGVGGSMDDSYSAGSYGGSVDVTSTDTGDVQLGVNGKAPHNSLSLPMGDQGEIDDWLDLSANKKLELVATAGSGILASSTMETVVETLWKY